MVTLISTTFPLQLVDQSDMRIYQLCVINHSREDEGQT